MGSLVTAIASYCDAEKNNGKWLVRIEDLDPPREVTGASKQIIKTLSNYGFEFDQNIIFQSSEYQQHKYNEALKILNSQSYTYCCSCSRAELNKQSKPIHFCRNTTTFSTKAPKKPYSIKIKVPDLKISFTDKIQNKYHRNLYKDCGDFVIQRKDKLFAYQIAVVVDDYRQGITNIVRGIDLIDSTPWQIYLNRILNFNQPSYAHLPILVNNKNQKLSKQTYAKEIDNENPLEILLHAYKYLNQKPHARTPKSIDEFWQHAIDAWQLNKIPKVAMIKV